jgi:uncharacterized protein with von Willebrand factor type A (vWA) domain
MPALKYYQAMLVPVPTKHEKLDILHRVPARYRNGTDVIVPFHRWHTELYVIYLTGKAEAPAFGTRQLHDRKPQPLLST